MSIPVHSLKENSKLAEKSSSPHTQRVTNFTALKHKERSSRKKKTLSEILDCKRNVENFTLCFLTGLTFVFLPQGKISSSSSSVICQKTGPKPLPKRFLHTVRSRASSFNWQYLLLFLRSSSSFLRLLPCLLVTSICLFIIPSITCYRRQFLCKMWPIQWAFRLLISCRIFLCPLTLSNTSSFLTWYTRIQYQTDFLSKFFRITIDLKL